MIDKVEKCREIIVDKIYTILSSGKEISAETFIGISRIIIDIKQEKEMSDTECMTTETI